MEDGSVHKAWWFAAGIAGLTGIGALDWVTGYQISFSIFYLLPIILVAAYSGRAAGFALSAIGAGCWYLAEVFAPGHYDFDHPAIPIWNAVMRLVLFAIVSWLVSRLRESAAHERELARMDFLTGAANSRYFHEVLGVELERLHRSGAPVSLAYVDLDDFKKVNDQYGHSKGDYVLQRAAEILKRHMRVRDVVARLGGDEFALLMPETGAEGAEAALSRVRQTFNEEMGLAKWPVTMSVGLVTFVELPDSPDLMIQAADRLMYQVKQSGKNSTRSQIFGAQAA